MTNHLGNVIATVSDRKRGVSLNNTTVDHYNAVIVTAQEYYPFGMLMPGRGGQIGTGRNIAGSIIKNGDTIPAILTVTQRTNNLPATYMATESINFEGEFASGNSDTFTTLLVDQSNADAGSDNGVSYGIAGKGYKYGFNGQEREDGIGGEGNSYYAQFWEYDSRIGRRWNIDPKGTADISGYNSFQGNPVSIIDPYGDEGTDWIGKKNRDGKTYKPVWDETVRSKEDVKNGDYYIGNDKVIVANDGNKYHLMSNGEASLYIPETEIKSGRKSNISQYTTLSSEPQSRPRKDLAGNQIPNTPGAVFDEQEKKSGYIWGHPAGDLRPDFIQASGSWTFPFGITPTVSFTLGRNGKLYFGLGGSAAGPKAGGLGITLNWLNHHDGSKDQLDNFLSGWGRSMSGGYYLGMQYSWSSDPTNKTTATGVGFISPGGGVGESYNFTITQTPLKW